MKNIEGYGYGKGYGHLADTWKALLDIINRLQVAIGIHVVIVAHSTLKHVDPPDEPAYDRYEMKLGKQSCPLLKEWADMVLFLNYKVIVVETDGKNKAQGGKRVMFADHSPCWDAKNRFGLKPEMSMDIKELSGLFSAYPEPKQETKIEVAKVEPKPEPKPEEPKTKPEPVPEPVKEPAMAPASPVDPEKEKLIDNLKVLMSMGGISLKDLQGEMHRKKVAPIDQTPRQYNVETLQRVVSGWNAIVHNIMSFKSKQQQVA